MLVAARVYGRAITGASLRIAEAAALLLTRLALAGVFWRAGRAKIEKDTWFTISDGTRFLFENDYSGVPLPPGIAAVLATTAEHTLPILLLLGLGTRFAALGLLGMTMVIQIFVYPEAWWTVHSLWAAMCLILMVRGAGMLSADALIASRRPH
jgi:putative oxidoreductase